jgi:CRISPR-associated RAMP protein (TIGR02581 family)
MVELLNRYRLQNRFVFKGKLAMKTAFHIGGGKFTLSNSDSPVILSAEGYPFIPGSSFKGALRSTVEKLVPGLPDTMGLFSCGLIDMDNAEIRQEQALGKLVCSTIRQREILQAQRENPGKAKQIQADSLKDQCHTCQLFGSPFAASRVNINDLYLSEEGWAGSVERRDGVAIDRDSETAKDRLKYDFEVVPASTVFQLEITLENVTLQDVQLLCVGLSEFVHGFGMIGGKRSRGLGACQIKELMVYALELEGDNRDTRLRDFLMRGEFSSKEDGESFLARNIEALFLSH